MQDMSAAAAEGRGAAAVMANSTGASVSVPLPPILLSLPPFPILASTILTKVLLPPPSIRF